MLLAHSGHQNKAASICKPQLLQRLKYWLNFLTSNLKGAYIFCNMVNSDIGQINLQDQLNFSKIAVFSDKKNHLIQLSLKIHYIEFNNTVPPCKLYVENLTLQITMRPYNSMQMCI